MFKNSHKAEGKVKMQHFKEKCYGHSDSVIGTGDVTAFVACWKWRFRCLAGVSIYSDISLSSSLLTLTACCRKYCAKNEAGYRSAIFLPLLHQLKSADCSPSAQKKHYPWFCFIWVLIVQIIEELAVPVEVLFEWVSVSERDKWGITG